MEYILNKIIDSKIKKQYREKSLSILEKYISFKRGYEFGFLNKAGIRFNIFRYHLGSYFAFVAAGINLYKINQLILKYTITLTQSKKPFILKLMRIPVGFFFYCFLVTIWHIPSFTIQFSFHSYMGMSQGLFRMLNCPSYIGQKFNHPSFEKMVLTKETDFV